MVSLSERYRRGEYKAVWRELDHSWIDGIRFRVPEPSQDDVEDVMRQTFERVARNVDWLIERLRDIGYAFECEREDDFPAAPPRRPVDEALFTGANTALARRFERLLPVGAPTPGVPEALVWFSRVVGDVDLRQRFEPQAELASGRLNPNDTAFILRNLNDPEAVDRHLEERGLSPERPPSKTIAIDPQRLGDFDPLAVRFDYLAYDVSDTDKDLLLAPDGGVGLAAEFAPSFEHKANVSGAINYHLYLPSARRDPIVFAERVRLPFTDYLRRVFARGGFFGVPRPVRANPPTLREVEPGIWLPDNPVLDQLAADMIRF